MPRDSWGIIRGRSERLFRPAHTGRGDTGAYPGVGAPGETAVVTGAWPSWSGSTITAHYAFLFGFAGSHGLGNGELL